MFQVSPWDKREEANEKKLAFAVASSDHLALLQAYKGWCHAAENGTRAGFLYCRENFLSWRGLQVRLRLLSSPPNDAFDRTLSRRRSPA